jgi:hypothetical protein
MTTIRKNFLIILALILVTTSASLFLSYIELPSTHHAPSLAVNATNIAPNEILGMEKLVVANGTEALQRVKQSHTGRIEDFRDVAIVHYVNEDRMLTLWTTLYPNETVAYIENEKMALAMQKWGGRWASNLKGVTIAGKPVYQTSSDNVTHYFWAESEWVFYIIPHNFTQDEIAEIIGAIP